MAGARPWNKGRSYENVKLRGRAKSKSHRAKLAAAKRNKCGPMSNAWKGGPGPEHRYRKRKGKYYHRWLAEEILQRKLDTDDHVHHIDRNRHNNSPENLVVLKSEDHLKLHRKIGKNSDIDQLAWLIGQDIKFEYLEEVYEKSGKSHAA